MTGIFFTIQIILAIVIVILTLLQKSESMGLGAYSSSNDTVFGAGGPMNFLTKATMVVGILLVLNTLTLVYLYNKQANTSAVDEVKVKHITPKQVPSVPTVPTK
ncbi:preprotein translocase subunit SecG [Caminibacter pacificus]|jgi:preprotein translocase subunit SecG|uniref:Protein-export membrane protein SecG n=1 Tax=Caminibacter pacificus TaxID=1424653 RepID=A0AAJ4UXA6_9BACT|nr:preprotein translocase subunit SecG [Caminibacter pacificus]NPA88250.1 preprotein translocase subunit SecG [Campylobacterota bacterium]QCI27461.1 preprotein translocase subunit SecG [Caminibacter pacificus]ROR38898.1 preprotein translocase subunit SecG [Caminibacter pacificus]